VVKRLIKKLFLPPDDPRVTERIECRGRDSGSTQVWTLSPKAFSAVRELDSRSITVEDDVQSFLVACVPAVKDTFLNMLLVNKSSAFVTNVTKLALIRKIVEAENADFVRIQECFRNTDWWRGEGFGVDHMAASRPALGAAVRLGRFRTVLKFIRDVQLIVGQALRSVCYLLKARKTLGFWEIPAPGAGNGRRLVDVFWVSPRSTSITWFEDFLRLARERSDIGTIRIANCPVLSPDDRKRLGLVWNRFRVSWLDLCMVCDKGVLARTRDVARGFRKHGDGEVAGLLRSMHTFWIAQALGTAENAAWEFVFQSTIARDRPAVAFFTHMHHPDVTAFSRAAASRDDVKTVSIQHGVNASAYYPLLFDSYWVLTSEDREYLESFGIDRDHIAVVDRVLATGSDTRATSVAGNNTSKKLLFIAQYPLDSGFSLAYILNYFDRVAEIAEKAGWEFLIRPHPAQKCIPNVEQLRAKHPKMRISGLQRSLHEELREERPAIVVSFFSTGILEGIRLNCLPVLLQVGLEALVDQANFRYDDFGIVVRYEDELEHTLTRVMLDEQYRAKHYARTWENWRQLVAGRVDLGTMFARQLDGD